MMDLSDMVAAERDRITQVLISCGVEKQRIDLLTDVIENTAWMKAKLDDTRTKIKDSSVVIPYDNGGGQKGLRENPLYKGYVSLFKSYMAGMKQILDLLPPAEAKQVVTVDKPKTVLELVRTKHSKEA